jgi:hypothetical protein
MRGLRAMGYLRRGDGTWTRVVGPVRVTFRPKREWVVRIGGYLKADFRTDGEDGFAAGHATLDRRYRFSSDRAPFAKELLADPGVQRALVALGADRISFRGDELTVWARRPHRGLHDGVVRLADALRATGSVDHGARSG